MVSLLKVGDFVSLERRWRRREVARSDGHRPRWNEPNPGRPSGSRPSPTRRAVATGWRAALPPLGFPSGIHRRPRSSSAAVGEVRCFESRGGAGVIVAGTDGDRPSGERTESGGPPESPPVPARRAPGPFSAASISDRRRPLSVGGETAAETARRAPRGPGPPARAACPGTRVPQASASAFRASSSAASTSSTSSSVRTSAIFHTGSWGPGTRPSMS